MARKLIIPIVVDSSAAKRGFSETSASAKAFERDISHAARGALAGSGAFHSLGRSIAFASGGFLAFASAGQFLRKSIDAARDAQVTQRQLAAQFRASGQDLGTYQDQINRTTDRLAALAGFENDELKAAFTTIFRTTGNVNEALRDTATAADVARAKHLGLAQSALIVAKTEAGNTTLLRRQGFQIAKNATAEQALAKLRQVVAGQARAGTTEQERFGAVLHDTEEIIGAGLLPTLNQYLAKGSAWLSQMNESGKLQEDIANDAHAVGSAIHAATDVVKAADEVTGSFANTLKTLAGVYLIVKARSALAFVGLTAKFEALTAAELGVVTQGQVAAERIAMYTGEMAASWGTVAAAADAAAAAEGRAGAVGGAAAGAGAAAAGAGAAGAGRVALGAEAAGAARVGVAARFGLASASEAFAGVFAIGDTAAEHKTYIENGRVKTKIGGKVVDFGPAPSVKGAALNPFAPNMFGSGSLGLGALTTKNQLPSFGTPIRSKGPSLAGQFNLAELGLANAQRGKDTGLQRRILLAEEAITLKLRDQASKLKDRIKFAQQAASIEGQIESIDQNRASDAAAERDRKKAAAAKVAAARQAAAAKAAAARAQEALGGVPLNLQLAQAKADAIAAGSNAQTMTKGQREAAEAIRAAERKAIKSHRLSMQGLIDAWNEIAQVNQQLASSKKARTTSTYHAVSTRALTAGLGLSRDARVSLEERLAQRAAHRGFAPNGPAALGQPVGGVTITGGVHLHGIRNVDQLYTELEKVGKRRGQRRGQR